MSADNLQFNPDAGLPLRDQAINALRRLRGEQYTCDVDLLTALADVVDKIIAAAAQASVVMLAAPYSVCDKPVSKSRSKKSAEADKSV